MTKHSPPLSPSRKCLKFDGKKVAYYIRMADGAPMPFAGLWEAWRSPEGQVLETCTILTTNANTTVAPIHNRMPVILHPVDFRLWLDREVHDADKTGGPVRALPGGPARGVQGFGVGQQSGS